MDLAILLSPSDDPQHMRACLESLARTLPPRLRCETILFGPPGFAAPVGEGFRVLPRVDPPNLAAARNAAVAASRAPVLCFLSPGTVLLPGWLPPMLDLLRRAPLAGCIGNVQREPYSGLIDQAGWRFDAEGLPIAVAYNQPLLPRETSDRHPAVSFACSLVSRQLFDRVGGFDTNFRGPLGDMDFCLRAAALGTRHFVANRSVVYHYVGALLNPDPAGDVARFRRLWGERARTAHARRAALRLDPAAAVRSREGWEIAREARRLERQAIADARRQGNTYLRKHLHRPWRYNYGRLCRALSQSLHPLPTALPITPGGQARNGSDLTRSDDGWLFDPPPQ